MATPPALGDLALGTLPRAAECAPFLTTLTPHGDPRIMVVEGEDSEEGERTYTAHDDEQNSVNQLIDTFNSIY